MKRTCNRCMANNGYPNRYCMLGFRKDKINDKPLVQCSKPLTIEKYLKELDNKRNQNVK